MDGTLAHFNSIKVRLKHALPTSEPKVSIFQFHKGTIKTHMGITCNPDNLYFNSIKVRLKHIVTLTTEEEERISIP